MLDPEAFRRWFLGFMQQFAEDIEGVVALDGKPALSEAEGTLRRSYDRAAGRSTLHLVSAWAGDGRNMQRRPGAKPEGILCGEPRPAAQTGAEPGAT